MDAGGVPFEELRASIELAGSDVLPNLGSYRNGGHETE
jgi:hypothetical protein